MANRRNVPGIRQYDHPAGGWGALRATAKAVKEQMGVVDAPLTLFRTNKPDGFDCPGCAWPDKEHTSTFQFCENGAKAVTWEATKKRVTPEFFAGHTVTSLLEWSDYALENEGRITHPMRYDSSQRHLSAGQLGSRLRQDRRSPAQPAGPEHGGILYVRPRLQ